MVYYETRMQLLVRASIILIPKDVFTSLDSLTWVVITQVSQDWQLRKMDILQKFRTNIGGTDISSWCLQRSCRFLPGGLCFDVNFSRQPWSMTVQLCKGLIVCGSICKKWSHETKQIHRLFDMCWLIYKLTNAMDSIAEVGTHIALLFGQNINTF